MSHEQEFTNRSEPESRVGVETGWELAHATNTDRSSAALSRRAIALLRSEVSQDDRDTKREVYDDANEYASFMGSLVMNGSVASQPKSVEDLRSYHKTKAIQMIEGTSGSRGDIRAAQTEATMFAAPKEHESRKRGLFRRK